MKNIVRKSLCWVLVCAMLLAQLLIPMPLQAQAATAVRPADTEVQNGMTLHCWNWSYANIIANLPTIAAQGFTSIQVSPIQQAKQPTMGGPVNDWWAFYQPADFAIDNTGVNAMGTKAEFMNLCETAHEYGIYVIVDVVANHMAAENYNRSPAVIEDLRNDNSCWHNKNSNINNYNSRENITQYDLDSVLDLNTGSAKVQQYVLNYLKELIDAGADGFRFDAVKHIETPDDRASFASDFWPTVIYGAEDYAESKGLDLYCYGELLHHPDDVNELPDSAYAKYYSVTDNYWGNQLRDAVVAAGNASAFTSTYHKNLTADQLVLWAESHDTYAGGNSGSVSEANINKTWALVAARADAMGLYLTRTEGFTPPHMLGTAYLSGWTEATVAAVNKFHKAFVGQSEYLSSSGSIAYVERGTSGAVLVNVGGNGASVSVKANKMASGTYKDQISGNTFTVSGGKITGNIGSTGIAVIYNVSSCSHSSHLIAGLCAACGASVSHSYVGGVCKCGKTKPVTSGCTHSEHRYNGICRGCGASVGHSYENGSCTVCGVEQPYDPFAYYLNGYINGSNVSEVNENYRFKDGKLVFHSSVDAYVSVRTYNGIYYQTTPDQQYNDTVTLHNACMGGNNSQMRVPGGKTVTLYLQSNYNGTYTLSYAEGGIVTPSTPTGSPSDYYLVGYINGANYGCEDDYANLGEYKFVDGKVTATFNQDSYIFVKNGDNSKWLLADSYCTDTSCTFSEGKSEKMFVPGGVEVTFTLTKNADGSVTVSYTTNGDSGNTGDTTTKTIYIDLTNSGWSKVNVYTWDAGGTACTGSWPGSPMTKVTGNIYSYEVPSNAANIIFNNGTEQTIDLLMPTGSKNLFSFFTGSWGTYTPIEGDTRTIYVDITGFKWSTVNVYTWDDAGNACTGAWPGSPMTKVKTNIYSYEVPTTAVNIIFNDGTNQSNDLVIPSDGSDLYNNMTNAWSTYATECSHNYIAKVTLAASCTQNGLRTYTCSLCSASYPESIPATGHNYTSKVTTAATCTTNGTKTFTCANCSDSYTEAIAATGHSYSTKVTAPTCEAQGYTTHTCSVCGSSYKDTYTNATGHSYSSKVTTAATCTTAGVKTFTCSKCKTSYTETIAATGHSYVNGICSNCGKADPNCNHSYTAKVTTAATCTTEGVKTYTCSKCGDVYTESIPVTDHSWSFGRCTGCGTVCDHNWIDGICKTCGSACGHKWSKGTCQVCSLVCSHANWVDGACVQCALTCSHNFVTGRCTVCGMSDPNYSASATYYLFGYINGANYACEEDYENMGQYKFVNGKVTATFNQDSYVAVKAEGNTAWYMTNGWLGTDVTSATLYNTEGLTDANKLYAPANVQLTFSLTENADGTLTLSYTTDTSGCSHSYTEKVTTAATCDKDGVKTFTCSKCGNTYTEAIPATGHFYSWRITTAAGCETSGVKTYTCDLCSHSYTEAIAATGHNYVDGTCSNCGASDPSLSTSAYVLVTELSEITSGGDFVIVAKNGITYRGMDTTLNGTKFAAVDVTVRDGKIIGNDLPVFTLTPASGGVKVSVDGQQLSFGITGILVVKQGTEGFTVVSKDLSTYGLLYQISADTFGVFATSNALNSDYIGNLQFYKYQEIEVCSHSYIEQITTAATCDKDGVKTFTCSKCGSSYTQTIPATGHNYVNGTCTGCGKSDGTVTPDPISTTYYLVGYINGANYGCEEDYENMGQYKFVNGKLTATFTTDSYIFLKTEGNGKWLLADSYNTDTTCTFFEDKSEKMFVPGNVEITFTLTENADGSVTLSYTTANDEPSVAPTLTLKYPTVSFEDVIVMNVYYTAENLEDVVEMGLITYSSNVSEWNIGNAEGVIPGYSYASDKQMYVSSTKGIAGKNLGDTLYFAVYAKLADGTYTYTKLVSYSPETYAYSQLSTGTAEVKALVVAMLKYGAAAQTFFGHNTDALVDRNLTAAQLALIEGYRADMMASVATPSTKKQGAFVATGGYVNRYPTISFEGAFSINYYYTPSYQPVDGITMYYWNQADYDAAEVLNAANCTGAIKMAGSGTSRYEAAVEDIAAKDLDKGIYVAFVYNDGTNSYASGVLSYSIGTYCTTSAAGSGAVAPLAAATAVYGYYAKQTFY